MTVLDHCRIVGRVAAALLDNLPHRVLEALPPHLAALAACHDVGKVSPGFQKKYFQQWLLQTCPAVAQRPCHLFEDRHGIVSEATLRAWAKQHGHNGEWQRWAQVLGVHHGSREEPLAEPCAKYGGPDWLAQRIGLIGALTAELGPMPVAPPSSSDLHLAAGLTCVADWVGSNEDWFSADIPPTADELPQRVQSALASAGLMVPEVRRGLEFGDLFPGFEPNGLQCAVHDLAEEPGLFVVEAPMGMGKTEAALYAAYRLITEGHNQGLYFALPTRLTSNRVHERVGGFLQRAFGGTVAARLVHGQAWLMELPSGGGELLPGGAWFTPLKRALLAPFGVGTIDQALLAVLNVRHAFVRSFGLAGKVVVLDEVHSYDAYTGTLLELLIRRLLELRCSVIVLSATLTQKRRRKLICMPTDNDDAYPLVTVRKETGIRTAMTAPPASRRVSCSYAPPDERRLADLAAGMAEEGRHVLWITNTVARSQAAWRAARSAVRQGIPVGLLHSRFPSWRRDELETEWLTRLGRNGDRTGGSVLVATQIVEQSVDIDADSLIMDLAPTDMLLQRLGRLWRHERPGRAGAASCVIVGEALHEALSADQLRHLLGPSRWVYAPYVLWRSFRLWHDLYTVGIPDDIRPLLEATYAEPATDDPAWVPDLLDELNKKRRSLESLATGMTRGDLPTFDDDEEEAPTRWSDRAMVQVLLLRECDIVGRVADLVLADGNAVRVSAEARSVQAARAIHRNLVSLPRYPDFVTASGVLPCLSSCIHGTVVLLRIDEAGQLRRQDNTSVAYAYDDLAGIRRIPRAPETRQADDREDIYESDW
jgi:CRISPR-associated endonuclease/helicase Cas3